METGTGSAVVSLYQPDAPDGVDPAKPFILITPEPADLRIWLRSFLAFLHARDREAVPVAPARIGDASRWSTPDELVLAGEIATLESEIEGIRRRIEKMSERLLAVSAAADSAERRLIWADGDDLVDALHVVLEALGFGVTNVDQVRQEGQPKREDLRAVDPEAPEWLAVVEVKGYSKGAKTNDLRQVREHREAYRDQEGSFPPSTWWIVNTQRTIDPSDRAPLDDNVDGAAQLVAATTISTLDLFTLWQAVATGALSPEAARTRLREAPPGVASPLM